MTPEFSVASSSGKMGGGWEGVSRDSTTTQLIDKIISGNDECRAEDKTGMGTSKFSKGDKCGELDARLKEKLGSPVAKQRGCWVIG